VANLKGGELANCAGASDSLVVGFLTHTGLSLNNEPSPYRILGVGLKFHG